MNDKKPNQTPTSRQALRQTNGGSAPAWNCNYHDEAIKTFRVIMLQLEALSWFHMISVEQYTELDVTFIVYWELSSDSQRHSTPAWVMHASWILCFNAALRLQPNSTLTRFPLTFPTRNQWENSCMWRNHGGEAHNLHREISQVVNTTLKLYHALAWWNVSSQTGYFYQICKQA